LLARRTRHVTHRQLNDEFGSVENQFWANLDHLDPWNAQSQSCRQSCRKELARQNSFVLRIVLKFDDVIIAVIASHEMRL
jgi:hypothetical protein